jgi:hypothetical protein
MPGFAHRRSRAISLLFLFSTAALEAGEWSASRPGRSLPPGKTGCSFYRRLDGPRGRFGRFGINRPSGIRSPDRPAPSQSLYQLNYPQWISVNYNHYSLNNIPEERSFQQTCVMLTVNDFGACRSPLFLNWNAPLTQTLGCTLQCIALLFILRIYYWYNCV